MQDMYVGLVLSMGLGLILMSPALTTSAQPLEKDIPTGNLTEDIDIAINPTEPLPPNGTVAYMFCIVGVNPLKCGVISV